MLRTKEGLRKTSGKFNFIGTISSLSNNSPFPEWRCIVIGEVGHVWELHIAHFISCVAAESFSKTEVVIQDLLGNEFSGKIILSGFRLPSLFLRPHIFRLSCTINSSLILLERKSTAVSLDCCLYHCSYYSLLLTLNPCEAFQHCYILKPEEQFISICIQTWISDHIRKAFQPSTCTARVDRKVCCRTVCLCNGLLFSFI